MNSLENRFFVYALVDPINRIPFYIGKGTGNRPYKHLLKNVKSNKDKIKYINSIRILGHEPEVHYIMENLIESDAYFYENFFIKHSKNIGINITNKVGLRMPPSRKGCKMSEEAKRKISESTKGKRKPPHSEETKKKISLLKKGKRRLDRLQIEKNFLVELYVNQNLSRKEIANMFSTSLFPINRLLKEYSIKKVKV
jgi:hypothetical protein